MRRHFIIAGLLASGCLGPAPDMDVGQTCGVEDMTVQVERGVAIPCDTLARALAAYRGAFEARFGRQDLGSIPVRLRAAQDLRETGVDVDFQVSGNTYRDAIDLAFGWEQAFPHELNHVRKGGGHGGWCLDYEPWSEEVLGINQRDYLGCK